MLPIVALLLACGGPTELSQPSDPPDPWPMSKAVLAHAAASQAAAATEEPAEAEAAPVEEETAPEASPEETPAEEEAPTPPEAP